MTHEEFMRLYDSSLQHGWVTSRDSAPAARQKEREREYNRQYYQQHKDKWKEHQDNFNTGMDTIRTGLSNAWRKHQENFNAGVNAIRNKNNSPSSSIPANQLKARESAAMTKSRRNAAAAAQKPINKGKRKIRQMLNSAKKKLNDTISNVMNSPSVRKARNKVKTFLDTHPIISGGEETLTTSSSKTTYDRHGNVIKEEHGDYSRELLTDLGKARYGRRR